MKTKPKTRKKASSSRKRLWSAKKDKHTGRLVEATTRAEARAKIKEAVGWQTFTLKDIGAA